MSNKLPIKKLSDDKGNYYSLSVGESVVLTHEIEVTGSIGKYKRGDKIPVATSVDEIITKMLTGSGSSSIIIDNDTIIQNNLGALAVNTDRIATVNTDQEITGTKTFKTIKIASSVIPEAKRQVIDPDPNGSFVIPSGLPELPSDGEIGSGIYVLSTNRNTGIVIQENANVELYIKDNVTVTSSNDGVYVKTGATLHLYNKGTIISTAHTEYSSVFNEGTCYIKGGSYKVGSDNKCYYAILNHGELLEVWNINVSINSGNASLFVSGYYFYKNGTNRSYISERKGSLTPKCIIHSGTFFNNSSTGTLKNDGGSTMIIYDGEFSGIGGQCLQNSGNECYIHGGIWTKDPVRPTRLIYDGSELEERIHGRSCKLVITGGKFECFGDYWLWLAFGDKEDTDLHITGGVYGTTTKYVYDTDENNNPLVWNLPFENLVDKNCITVTDNDGYITVYPMSEILSSLNGIKFIDGNDIKSLKDGLVISKVKDINDENSAVSKKYVDSKTIDKYSYSDKFDLTTETGRIDAIKSLLTKLGATNISL